MLKEQLGMKKKKFAVLGITICAAMLCLLWIGTRQKTIVFNVAEETTIEVEYGTQLELPKVEAVCRALFFQNEIPLEVHSEGSVDETKVGSYTLHYSAEYQDIIEEIDLHVIVKDTQAPVITLVSNPENFTSPAASYQEEGFTAVDNYDGDITERVERIEEKDTVIYRVTDSSGNETVVEREIIYKDVIAPVLSLKGDANISLSVGSSYEEPGFEAMDDCDGDITGNVSIEGTVDTMTAGTYVLLYKVVDSSGNSSQAERKISVKKEVSIPTSEKEKTIYLTFDDGPGPYTQKLLDILDVYQVKVTFFVTGMQPKYYDLIGEAYRRGHTIGLHTYSHEYSSIYSSIENYYEDFQKIRDIVVEQTGEEPLMVRFPGGTSNSVSKKYCSGIMTRLSEELPAKGYRYFDWNVSSGDAVGKISEQEIINNVIQGISGKKVSVVLQHDINSISVEAVDDIIEWGLANGYTFEAMDENTALIQHKAKN